MSTAEAAGGFVYGGLIASLVDCHAMATAAGASMPEAGLTPGQRKVVVHVEFAAAGVVCYRGRVIAVPLPATMAASAG